MKLLVVLLFCGCSSVKPVVVQETPQALFHKQLSENLVVPDVQQTITMSWPDDPWLQSGSWIIVESDVPYGPFTYYAQTTQPWLIIPITNSQRFFNYCRAEDYNP